MVPLQTLRNLSELVLVAHKPSDMLREKKIYITWFWDKEAKF